jgi:hypothetical protein
MICTPSRRASLTSAIRSVLHSASELNSRSRFELFCSVQPPPSPSTPTCSVFSGRVPGSACVGVLVLFLEWPLSLEFEDRGRPRL